MIQSLTTGWNFWRFFRLALGGILLYNAFMGKDAIAAVLGSLLVIQASTNTGCSMAGCQTNAPTKLNQKSQEITFEEIK